MSFGCHSVVIRLSFGCHSVVIVGMCAFDYFFSAFLHLSAREAPFGCESVVIGCNWFACVCHAQAVDLECVMVTELVVLVTEFRLLNVLFEMLAVCGIRCFGAQILISELQRKVFCIEFAIGCECVVSLCACMHHADDMRVV